MIVRGSVPSNDTLPNGQFSYFINNSGFSPRTDTLRPRKLINKLNGVTSADVTRIQQHIVGSVPFTNAFDLFAADVNRDRTLNSVDAAILAQSLNGNQAALIQFDSSWRFVSTSYVLPSGPFYPTPAPGNAFWSVPHHRTFTNLTNDAINQDFWGIKIGDVVTPIANPANRPSADDALMLVGNDRVLKVGEETTISVRVLNFQDIVAMQFALGFDNSKLEFKGVTTPPSSPFRPDHFGLFNTADGEIRAVWNVIQGLNLQNGSVVFNLTFKALEDKVRLSQVLTLLDEVLPGEAYHTDLSPLDIELQFIQRARPAAAQRDEEEIINDGTPEVVLLQNTPNPFYDKTRIGFVLSEPMDAQLRVFDVTGRLIFEHAGNYPAGYNTVDLQLDSNAKRGLMIYELTTPYGTQTRKMISAE